MIQLERQLERQGQFVFIFGDNTGMGYIPKGQRLMETASLQGRVARLSTSSSGEGDDKIVSPGRLRLLPMVLIAFTESFRR